MYCARAKNQPSRAKRISPLLAIAILLAFASCGGPSAGRSAGGFTAGTAGYVPYPGGIAPQFMSAHATKYTSINKWLLFSGTKKWTWISAIGSTPGLTASMSNPFSEVAVGIIPTSTYNNAGQVTFYIDGKQTATLDLSQKTPFKDYSDSRVSYFVIAKDLPETAHTVSMKISTGTIAFDGWRMLYNDAYYIIDAADINTLEANTINNTAVLRAGIEEYFHAKKSYPNPSGDLAPYLRENGYLSSVPTNPFTGKNMTQSATSTYSAGDYRYTYVSQTEYTLKIDGGAGELVTLSPDSAKSELFDVEITTPANHTTTTSSTITFTGTATVPDGANMTVCCALSGEIYFPIKTGPINTTVTLKEGRNDIKFTLEDALGNDIQFGYTITKDTTAPNIKITAPPLTGPSGSQVANITASPVTIETFVEPGATVTINGQAATESAKSPGLFSASLQLQTGSTTVTVTAADPSGNSSTFSFVVILI